MIELDYNYNSQLKDSKINMKSKKREGNEGIIELDYSLK